MRKKKTKFLRQGWHSLKRLQKVKWRKPRGSQSKTRRGEKGKAAMPRIGYGTAKRIRGLHPSGFKEVIVYSPNELKNLDVKKEAVRIAARVGKKKRMEILERAKEMKIKVLNP